MCRVRQALPVHRSRGKGKQWQGGPHSVHRCTGGPVHALPYCARCLLDTQPAVVGIMHAASRDQAFWWALLTI
jgi:hypothetical protein